MYTLANVLILLGSIGFLSRLKQSDNACEMFILAYAILMRLMFIDLNETLIQCAAEWRSNLASNCETQCARRARLHDCSPHCVRLRASHDYFELIDSTLNLIFLMGVVLTIAGIVFMPPMKVGMGKVGLCVWTAGSFLMQLVYASKLFVVSLLHSRR